VGFGVLLLHEEVTPAFLAGAVLVLVGIVLVSRRSGRSRVSSSAFSKRIYESD